MTAPNPSGNNEPGNGQSGNEPGNNESGNNEPGNGQPASNEPGSKQGDDNKWDEAAAKRKFDRMKADLDKARADAAKFKTGHDEYEKKRQAELPEIERLKEQLAQLQQENEKHSARQVRLDAAEAAGLPIKFSKFITATDAKEALEQAKELAAELNTSDKPNSGRPDLRQGNRGNAPAPKVDANTLIRQMAGH